MKNSLRNRSFVMVSCLIVFLNVNSAIAADSTVVQKCVSSTLQLRKCDSISTRNYILGGLDILLWSMDCGQTLYIVNHPNQFYEMNPYLGKHPRQSLVNEYFAAIIVIQEAVLTYFIPNTRIYEPIDITWRDIYLAANIYQEATNVVNNFSIGIMIVF
jgi:hypothetical protein